MRARHLMVAAVLGLSVSGVIPACAAGDLQPYPEFEATLNGLVPPQAWLKGRITEADAALIFSYVRASLFAAAQGLPAPAVPGELKRRVEELQRDLEAQGALSALLLLNALEAAARQAVRESLVDPGTKP